MIATPNVQQYSSPGNTQFTVNVPSTALGSVVFAGDLGLACVYATVAPGSTVTFYAPQGFFFYWTSIGDVGWTLTTAIQGFAAAPILSQFAPSRYFNVLTNSTLGQNSLFFQPFDLYQSLDAYRLNNYISVATSISASNETASQGVTMSAALYSQGTGTASDIIGTFWSGSAFLSAAWSSNSNATFAIPYGISNSLQGSSLSTTFAATNASTWMATSMGGFREVVYPVSMTLAPGRYWYAFAQSSATGATADFRLSCNYLQETASNQINFQEFGTNSSASNASYPQFNPGLGTYSATSAAFPATVALTGGGILGSPTLAVPAFNFSGYTSNLSEN